MDRLKHVELITYITELCNVQKLKYCFLVGFLLNKKSVAEANSHSFKNVRWLIAIQLALDIRFDIRFEHECRLQNCFKKTNNRAKFFIAKMSLLIGTLLKKINTNNIK